MKRFTLLIFLTSIMVVSYGQMLKSVTPGKNTFSKQEASDDAVTNQDFRKAGGDIIWQTTFNWGDSTKPRGYALPDGWTVKDNSDKGSVWVWRQNHIGGNYTTINTPPSHFISKTDGFICLPMDEYNSLDGATLENAADSYIQTAPIDCSQAGSVVVKFNQLFRLCCLASQAYHYIQMFVTTDNVHWSAPFDCNFNSAFGQYTETRYRSVEFNISDIAAGSNTVQIRFYMNGASHYMWAIDDLRLVEAFQNEVVLEDSWMDFDGGAGATLGQINNWPLSQMGIVGTTSGNVGDYYLKAAFINNGTETAGNTKLDLKVLKNGTQVFSDVSSGKTLMSQARDTQMITNPYLASDFGDYIFEYKAVFDNPDEIPANNTAKKYFTVNDTLFLRSDFTAESSYFTDTWVRGGRAGEMVGVDYEVYKPAEINYLTAYLAGFETAFSPQFQFLLMKAAPDVDYIEWIASEVIDMDSSYMNRWVTLPVTKDGEKEFLTPGNYAVVVKVMGTDPATGHDTTGIRVGWDWSSKASHDLVYYVGSDGGWFNYDRMLPMVGFSIKASGGPTQAPVTFNVDMSKHITNGEFKPGIDMVTVNGLADSWNGTVTMTDPDANGIYSATVAGLKVAGVLNYKYAINGTKEAFPLTGDPYRKWTVRYFNNTNDTYNGGVTTGVDPISLVASFSVYPNPAQGAFNVAVTNTVPSDLVITLSNIRGQVIYRNSVAKVLNHLETIDQNLSKGLYFLSINNGKEVKVKKIMIQ